MDENSTVTMSKPEEEDLSNEGEDETKKALAEANKTISELTERHRMQSHQLLMWRRRFKAQEEHLTRINLERNEQLRKLSVQLLVFEARLCRKQREISNLLCQREAIIARQQKVIKQLQRRLSEAGLELQAEETNLDSLNDSDSAVIMEDDDVIPMYNGVTVMRSVSDALETPNSNKYSMLRRSNCLLRRPEILETVYSVEEDGEADGAVTPTPPDNHDNDDDESSPPSPEETHHHHLRRPPRLKDLSGSFERLDQEPPPPHLTAYNRVMSNHRSVIKPKDVKYKRINKAKSKSLEELRGRLKNWVDKGAKAASLEISTP